MCMLFCVQNAINTPKLSEKNGCRSKMYCAYIEMNHNLCCLGKWFNSSFQSCMKMNSRFYTQRRSDDDQTETSITKTQMNHFFCNFQDFQKDAFKTVEISVSKNGNNISGLGFKPRFPIFQN